LKQSAVEVLTIYHIFAVQFYGLSPEVLRGAYTQLYQTWTGHKAIIATQSINHFLFANAVTSKQQKSVQAARTGNSPTKLATLRQKDRQITVHITTQKKRI